MKSKFSSFEEFHAEMTDRKLSTRGISVQDRMVSVRPLRIPLEPTNGRSSVPAISWRVTESNNNRLLVQLLWHAMFGKKFKVSHWHFLFELVDRTTKWTLKLQVIFDVLMIINSTPSGGSFRSFNENMKSAKSLLVDPTQFFEMLEMFKLAGIALPNKAVELDLLIHVNYDDVIRLTKPKDAARIGVGYRDKGSLGAVGNEYEPYEISPMSNTFDDSFITLMKNYKRKNYLLR